MEAQICGQFFFSGWWRTILSVVAKYATSVHEWFVSQQGKIVD